MEPISLKKLLAGIADTQDTTPVTEVVTDSRRAGPGCVFAAIRGERVDGHDFAAKALAAGAAAVIAERPIPGLADGRVYQVANTRDALIAMAGNYRAAFDPVLVGITGSVGKTTTKEFCAAVFSAFGPTLKTEGNQNNEIGMPATLFRLTPRAPARRSSPGSGSPTSRIWAVRRTSSRPKWRSATGCRTTGCWL